MDDLKNIFTEKEDFFLVLTLFEHEYCGASMKSSIVEIYRNPMTPVSSENSIKVEVFVKREDFNKKYGFLLMDRDLIKVTYTELNGQVVTFHIHKEEYNGEKEY